MVERRSANRVIYSLVSDRLASHVGAFLATVCPPAASVRRQGKKRAKAAPKSPGKSKRKTAGSLEASRPPAEMPAYPPGTGPAPFSATL